MKEQYVILTGGKNNAGDFLIKHRAKELLLAFRPDRVIIEYDGWKLFTTKQLKEINQSKTLILTGGPALQRNMVPQVYPLTPHLDDIEVPIITMGIGWKSPKGDWDCTHNYKLNRKSQLLLERIAQSGYFSSVRDYHTLNTLFSKCVKNVLMTGCPALYSLEHINKHFYKENSHPKKIAFSMGVAFVESRTMEQVVKRIILQLSEYYIGSCFEVVFHHSVDEEMFDKVYKGMRGKSTFIKKHKEFLRWLSGHQIKYYDISGSAENLIRYYQSCDLHIGYRVHAHIFMSSISKPSVLLTEDGRAKGQKEVLGGVIFNGYSHFSESFMARILNRLKINYDRYHAVENLGSDLITNLDYEFKVGMPRLSMPRSNIDRHFMVMKRFLEQLP